MRNHGTLGKEATAAFVEVFCSEAMRAMVNVRKARERKARRAKAPKRFVVRGFSPAPSKPAKSAAPASFRVSGFSSEAA